MALSREALRRARVERQGEAVVRRLESAVVGIAGLGGLGSHIAVSLARLGVGKLVLADFDRVDVTNLHRQQYFAEQLGRYKTDALAETLRRVDPWLSCELHPVRLTPENLPGIFAGCSVLCEAFDRPEEKAMLIETALTELPHTVVVSGSGMAGIGSANTIQTVRAMNRLYLCGDGETDVATSGSLTASRVSVCAGHQAHMVLRLLLGDETP